MRGLIALIAVVLAANHIIQYFLAAANTRGEKVYLFWGSVADTLATLILFIALVALLLVAAVRLVRGAPAS